MEIHENLELGNLVIGAEVEVWKKVNEVEELEMFRDWYWVSSFGRVKSTRGNKKILRQATNKGGYLRVGLMTLEKFYDKDLRCTGLLKSLCFLAKDVAEILKLKGEV